MTKKEYLEIINKAFIYAPGIMPISEFGVKQFMVVQFVENNKLITGIVQDGTLSLNKMEIKREYSIKHLSSNIYYNVNSYYIAPCEHPYAVKDAMRKFVIDNTTFDIINTKESLHKFRAYFSRYYFWDRGYQNCYNKKYSNFTDAKKILSSYAYERVEKMSGEDIRNFFVKYKPVDKNIKVVIANYIMQENPDIVPFIRELLSGGYI